ncbi:hypothetical protein MetexDRAFT_2411 [Methylorubrum extorquens DSM 13060]|uniref:Uncharacterized protein n=1 Tax=Methylorubrum extorquens DSM 13060 TaxID=882800 RepID=H1KIE9_METEX|nr:hypothetical protein MetexDRAFT_2411 [Methylorubrum extorquens DSM 13060]
MPQEPRGPPRNIPRLLRRRNEGLRGVGCPRCRLGSPLKETACRSCANRSFGRGSGDISVMFGEGSPFHTAHGFDIDGIDGRTAPSAAGLAPADGRQGGAWPPQDNPDGCGSWSRGLHRFRGRTPRRQGWELHRGLPHWPLSAINRRGSRAPARGGEHATLSRPYAVRICHGRGAISLGPCSERGGRTRRRARQPFGPSRRRAGRDGSLPNEGRGTDAGGMGHAPANSRRATRQLDRGPATQPRVPGVATGKIGVVEMRSALSLPAQQTRSEERPRQRAQGNGTAVPDGHERHRVVHAMDGIAHCAHAS